MEGPAKEFERLRKRQRTSSARTLQSLDGALTLLRDFQAATSTSSSGTGIGTGAPGGGAAGGGLASGMEVDEPSPASTTAALSKLKAGLVDAAGRVKADVKELHGPLSKFGKAIDKAFPSSLAKLGQPDLDTASPHLALGIAEHLYRQGSAEAASTLLDEAGLRFDPAQRAGFDEMNRTLAQLQARDIGPALRWAQANRARLQPDLEFALHRLQFVSLLERQQLLKASKYAQDNFPAFARSKLTEIKHLMGAFLYVHKLRDSAYAALLSPSHWEAAAELFTRERCGLQGLANESPLAQSVNAGAIAVPKLLKVTAALERAKKGVSFWKKGEQLPTEIDLGRNRVYHTVFACPVSREQSTPSNPPMRLPCGHVLAKESLNKITKGSRRKFKCTYCPHEQLLRDAVELHF